MEVTFAYGPWLPLLPGKGVVAIDVVICMVLVVLSEDGEWKDSIRVGAVASLVGYMNPVKFWGMRRADESSS